MTLYRTPEQVTHGTPRRSTTTEDAALYARLHPSCPRCRTTLYVLDEDGEERYACLNGHQFDLVEIDEALAEVGR